MVTEQKLNCWQFKNCGREKGGLLADILGECPVSTSMKYDGMHGGRGGGRACWMIPDSACRKDPANSNPLMRCHACEFYRRVVFEEDDKVVHKYSSVLA